MAAGTQYSKSLNLDIVGVKTPAGYDSAIDEWVMTEKLVGALARTATLQSGATANGNGTSMDVSELATVIFDVQGTFSATINFEGTTDDTVWAPILVTAMGTGTIAATTTTTGLYRAVVTGLKSVRARISNYSSGSITVKARGTPLAAPSKAVQLTGSKVKIAQISINQTTTVNAGQTESVNIYAPTGWIAKKVHTVLIYILAPTGATTGTHAVYLATGEWIGGDTEQGIVASTSYNGSFNFRPYCMWSDSSTLSKKYPADYNAEILTFNTLAFDDVTPIKLSYTNSTDVAQTNPRKVLIRVTLEAKVS